VILSFVSRKGGVGKTTSVVSLAGALVRLGHKVLVIDLDAQASASRSLGVERERLAPSMHDVLFRNVPLWRAVRSSGIERLDLVTGSADLMHADLDLQNLRHREQRLVEVLRPAAGAWDWVLIDCPPAVGSLAHLAIVASDAYVVPTPPHFLAFEGIDVLLGWTERQLAKLGRPDSLGGILLTMVDYRTSAARAHAAELRLKYGLRLLDTEIPANVRLAEGPAAGLTVFERDPKASGAHAYRLLATELLSRLRPRIDAVPAASAERGHRAPASKPPAPAAPETPAPPAPDEPAGAPPAAAAEPAKPAAPAAPSLAELPDPPGRPN
jgi:chromosome partitioning protein